MQEAWPLVVGIVSILFSVLVIAKVAGLYRGLIFYRGGHLSNRKILLVDLV